MVAPVPLPFTTTVLRSLTPHALPKTYAPVPDVGGSALHTFINPAQSPAVASDDDTLATASNVHTKRVPRMTASL
jgi:hypothetical protein